MQFAVINATLKVLHYVVVVSMRNHTSCVYYWIKKVKAHEHELILLHILSFLEHLFAFFNHKMRCFLICLPLIQVDKNKIVIHLRSTIWWYCRTKFTNVKSRRKNTFSINWYFSILLQIKLCLLSNMHSSYYRNHRKNGTLFRKVYCKPKLT